MDETGLRVRKKRGEEGEEDDAEEEIDGFAAALPPRCSRILFAGIVLEHVVAFESAGGGTALRRNPNELRECERRGTDNEVDKDGTATALRPFESVSVPRLRGSNPPSDSSDSRDVLVHRAAEGDEQSREKDPSEGGSGSGGRRGSQKADSDNRDDRGREGVEEERRDDIRAGRECSRERRVGEDERDGGSDREREPGERECYGFLASAGRALVVWNAVSAQLPVPARVL